MLATRKRRIANKKWSSSTRKSSCLFVFVCVWSHQEDFRHLSFQGWRTADSGGTLSDWNVFVPKGHLQFPGEGFLNCGICVRFNGQANVLIHGNTAPCWAKENTWRWNPYFFFIIIIIIFIKNDWPGLFLSAGETCTFPHYSSFHKNQFWSILLTHWHESAGLILVQKVTVSVFAKTDLLEKFKIWFITFLFIIQFKF